MTSSTPKRQYKPGFRRPNSARPWGQVGESQVAWVETNYGTIALFALPENSEDERNGGLNPGPSVHMSFPPKYNVLKLTSLTVEELNTLKKFFDMAFELALPVAAERDRVSEIEQAKGNDAVIRAYRRAPRMVVRPGPLAEYHKGVLFGSPEVPGGSENADGDSGGAGGSGPGVAADEQEQAGATDDASKIDES